LRKIDLIDLIERTIRGNRIKREQAKYITGLIFSINLFLYPGFLISHSQDESTIKIPDHEKAKNKHYNKRINLEKK